MTFTICVATEQHYSFAEEIVDTIYQAAQHRGTGIAKRTPEYIRAKMDEGKAIVAIAEDGRFAGFCYIESWDEKKFVATSGLIVAPDFRHMHLARRIKAAAVDRAREMFPGAKLFGITTSAAVMKINSDLGYRPVHFSELPQDEVFWKGCSSCPNYDILERTKRAMCLCTAMLHQGDRS
jgi:N-acetylglutamate synthase-like GNAT family acetyltransferase